MAIFPHSGVAERIRSAFLAVREMIAGRAPRAFVEHPLLPATLEEVKRIIRQNGGNVEVVDKAVKLLEARGIALNQDDFQIAKTIAQIDLDPRSPLKAEAVVASFFSRPMARHEISEGEVRSAFSAEDPKGDIALLAYEVGQISDFPSQSIAEEP